MFKYLKESKKNVVSTTLLILRILIGWHFLYEGLAKLFSPSWSAYGYLVNSKWIFAGLFNWMASSESILKMVDILNIWGLILIGLSLFTGLMVRWASIAGATMLLFYFVAYPPIPGYTFGSITEGSYLWVNKTLIEFFALLVYSVLPIGFLSGADRWIKRWKEEKAHAPIPVEKNEGTSRLRREVLRDLISVPFLGAFAYAIYKKNKWNSYEEKVLKNTDATTSATVKSFGFSDLKELKGQMPSTRIIGGVEFSRIILGGNLIGGWAHARDLLYVSKLIKAYHTDEKVFNTFALAEKCGINAILTNTALCRVINKYWRNNVGNIKFISDCGGAGDLLTGAKLSIDSGASACYVHGGWSDGFASKGKFDEIQKVVEFIRQNGLPAGIGGHKIETIKGCVEYGLKPDFWMKTLHHHNYWSSNNGTKGKDNLWCEKPEETIEFMKGLDSPWIAYKVLAAGAITPEEGFKYAFDNGADFVCAGMYDFQIVEDANIALNILNSDFKDSRKRRWLV